MVEWSATFAERKVVEPRGVVTLKVRRGGSEQLVTFYKAAAATRTGIALES